MVRLFGHLLLKYFRFGSLWIAEIHHLIQQLVNDDKVIPYTFLLQLFEVFGEHFDDLMEEKQDLSGIRIPFRKCEEVEIIVANVQVLAALSIPFTISVRPRAW